ncbi:hypothetical protein ACFL2Q_12340 [Thermodesulfobacteriota bacterium]
MKFYEEPPHYEKTILSDLQGGWGNLRQAVVENHPFLGSDKLLFHIDEAMSWESVRISRPRSQAPRWISLQKTFCIWLNGSAHLKAFTI